MQQPLSSEKLCAEAGRVRAAFAALQHLVVVESPMKNPRVDAPLAALAPIEPKSLARFFNHVAEEMAETNAIGMTRIALNIPWLFVPEDGIRRIRLYHEFGHLAVEDGFSPVEHDSECSAETLAVLDHLQHTPEDKETLRAHLIDAAIAGVLYGNVDHYTVPAILGAVTAAETRDISKLSLPQMAAYAGEIAKATRLNADDRARLQSVYDAARNEEGELGAEEIVQIMHTYRDDPLIHTAGAYAIAAPHIQQYLTDIGHGTTAKAAAAIVAKGARL